MAVKPVVADGGISMSNQLSRLADGCNILIATPGRLMDLIGKELCRYHYNKLIVNKNHWLTTVQQCAYPKHEECIKSNKRGRPRKIFLKKFHSDFYLF